MNKYASLHQNFLITGSSSNAGDSGLKVSSSLLAETTALSVRGVSEAGIHGLIFIIALCCHSGKKSPHGLNTLIQPDTGLPVIEVVHRRVAGSVHRQCQRIPRVHDGGLRETK